MCMCIHTHIHTHTHKILKLSLLCFLIGRWVLYHWATREAHIYIFFHILFHYSLSQNIKYSSLCYTAGPCCLSILYVIVCI